MKTMKAAVLTGVKTFEYIDVKRPAPQLNEVLIRIKAVGICGTDMELYNGTMPFFEMGLCKYPLIPGHEWSGIIEEVGGDVTDLKPGDKVTGDVSIGCGKCLFCKRGLYNLCKNRCEVGISGGKDGAYADFLVMPEQFTYKLPGSLSFDEAAMTETTATLVKSIWKAPIKLGEIVLILGAGPIGLMALQAANAAGAGYTIVADRLKAKLDLAYQLGASKTIDTSVQDLSEVVKDLTDQRGVDYVLEASGSVELMSLASSLTKDAGVINTVGIYTKKIPEFDVSDIVLRDITLSGSVASPNVYEATLRLMDSGKIKTKPCISHRFALKDFAQAVTAQEQSLADRTKIMLYPDGI
jgi:L-iditol 2-dehydrogenase